ncbi:MAG: amidophosphoribosyltransferase, partial [Clostridiales bacterium]|nr:amidophosphoribosyltransferase [Clostridiales bacterium]
MRKIKEECGIFGMISTDPMPLAGYAASALLALQHRGQEGAGIATFYSDNTLVCHKNVGLVNDIFGDFTRHVPNTNVAVGHVRYSTTGNNTVENTQPIETVHSRLTCALAHNGNITNAAKLRGQMVNQGGKVFHTTNDSEIINMLLIEQMIHCGNIEKAVFNVMNILEGAFSLVIATPDKLIAARDKCGFRPLCMGKLGNATVFASESCALDSIGATFVRDIEAGELVSIDRAGKEVTMRQKDRSCRGLCVFEMIYIARSDSFIDGMSVYNARLEMGRALYRQKPIDADFVCGVPDSGLDAALGYSLESGIPFAPAFVKNRYMGRSFIQPSQGAR